MEKDAEEKEKNRASTPIPDEDRVREVTIDGQKALESARLLAEMSKDSVKINFDAVKGQVKSIETKAYGMHGTDAGKDAVDALVVTLGEIEAQMPGLIPESIMERVKNGHPTSIE